MSKETYDRKNEHIDIVLNEDVEFVENMTGFECVNIIHKSLPELDMSSINIETEFMGKKISAPFIISAVTGGTERAARINIRLAETAQKLNIPICLGSQRAMIEDKNLISSYDIRDHAGDVPIIGNIGIVQLKHYGPEQVIDAVERISADGIAVHINPEQEAIQHKGDVDFSGCLNVLEDLVKHAGKVHVMVKEVGHGIDYDTAKSLKRIGVEYLDVAGAGGTSWTKIEGIRRRLRGGHEIHGFDDWGIPTVVSLLMAKKAGWGMNINGKHNHKHRLISSGGVRSGIDVSKSLLLGADYAGAALPILISKDPVRLISEWMEQFKIVMFLCGASNIDEFKSSDRYTISGWVNDWL